jgi:hypothetical protein
VRLPWRAARHRYPEFAAGQSAFGQFPDALLQDFRVPAGDATNVKKQMA